MTPDERTLRDQIVHDLDGLHIGDPDDPWQSPADRAWNQCASAAVRIAAGTADLSPTGALRSLAEDLRRQALAIRAEGRTATAEGVMWAAEYAAARALEVR